VQDWMQPEMVHMSDYKGQLRPNETATGAEAT
jgi:hypothetical protein